MNFHRYLIVGLMLLLLAACSLPAPDEVLTSPSPDTGAEVSPTVTSFDDIISEPTQTPVYSEMEDIQPTLPQESAESTPTIVATNEPVRTFRYTLQAGTPIGTSNIIKPEAGCNWMGVGGQVFSRNETPVIGLVVEVAGTLDDSPVLALTMTGESSVLGPGGYEIKLSDELVASESTLWLQLHDLHGNPQSDKMFFDTYSGEDACDKNLIIINFIELSSNLLEQYLPSIFNDQ